MARTILRVEVVRSERKENRHKGLLIYHWYCEVIPSGLICKVVQLNIQISQVSATADFEVVGFIPASYAVL